ncbi:MAG: DUF6316 family protein [Pseudomonadota bacterium]
MQRATDPGPIHTFRTERFFTSDGLWYFATREQVDMGPYPSRLDARRATARYIDTQQTLARLRQGNAVRETDADFDPRGIAARARDLSELASREVGRVRGDDRLMDKDFGGSLAD